MTPPITTLPEVLPTMMVMALPVLGLIKVVKMAESKQEVRGKE